MDTRREFLGKVTAGAASAVLTGTSSLKAKNISPNPQTGLITGEIITLGRTGLKVSRIGLGSAYFTNNKTDEEAARFVHTMLDEGINLIDTAWNYGENGASWRVLGKVFKERKREDFVLSNKLEWRDSRSIAHKTVEEQVDESLKILNVDHIDIYLIHNVERPESYYLFVKRRYIEDMIKIREKGKIGFIGITGHNHPTMIRMLKQYPEIDVVMGGQNVMREFFFFVRDARYLDEYAGRHKLGILSMKPIAEGNITQNQDVALKYAMTQPNSVPIPGMSEIEHIKMNVRAVREFCQLSPEAQQQWRKPETILDGPACTQCGYCNNIGSPDSDEPKPTVLSIFSCGNVDTKPIDVPQLVLAAQYGERFVMKKWISIDQIKLSQDLKKITPAMAKRFEHRCPLELPVEDLLKKSARYVF